MILRLMLLSLTATVVDGYLMSQLTAMCQQMKDENDICQVREMEFEQDSDYVWENPESGGLKGITMDFSKFECKKSNLAGCKLTLKLTKKGSFKLNLLGGSRIVGSEIFIYSPTSETYTQITIDEQSRITASGKSMNTKGSSNARFRQGASYIGQGGFCDLNGIHTFIDHTYGTFNMIPNLDDIYDTQNRHKNLLAGSMGEVEDSVGACKTCGGGRIHLQIDNLVLIGSNQHIQANGFPELQDPAPENNNQTGGSGGYIFLRTLQVNALNNLDTFATITAIGGYGKNYGMGGAGGLIVTETNLTKDQINATYSLHAHGGTSGDGWLAPVDEDAPMLSPDMATHICGTAAGGAIYGYFTNSLQQDSLYITNNFQVTDRFTVASAAMNAFGENVIVEDLYIEKHGQLSIKNTEMDDITFPSLHMTAHSLIYFDVVGATRLAVRSRKHFHMDKKATMDFSKVSLITRFEFIESNEETHEILTEMNLGIILFNHGLYIDVPNLNLYGDVNDTKTHTYPHIYSGLQFVGNNITIKEGARLVTDKYFIHARSTFEMERGAQILSMIENECFEDPESEKFKRIGDRDHYSCMGKDLHYKNPLDEEYIIRRFNNFYDLEYDPTNATSRYLETIDTHSSMGGLVNDRWDAYITALDLAKMTDARIQAPRISLCSNHIQLYEKSKIDANFQGCRADEGRGNTRLPRDSTCAGAGGGHAGNGGSGGSQNSEEVKCQEAYPIAQKFYHGAEAKSEGSGGTSGLNEENTGGSGGGIAWLLTPKTIILDDSSVEADGRWGSLTSYEHTGSGGGSGGAIQLMTQNLMGDGHVSVKGGSGSTQGGGGGSGGRLIINFLRSYLNSSNPKQSFSWRGSYDISGGKGGDHKFQKIFPTDGQQGTVISPKCFPGYHGIFCTPCPIGYYKNDYSYSECKECINRPQNSYYTKMAEDKVNCEYECNEYAYESAKTNRDCLDQPTLEYERIGGGLNFMLVLLGFLFLSLTIYIAMTKRKSVNDMTLRDISETIYTTWEERDQIGRGNCSEDNLSLTDMTIWCHSHRMYLIGSNSVKHPWFIPKDFPRDALDKTHREKFVSEIPRLNELLEWNWCERITFSMVSLLYNPLAKSVHNCFRKRKFRNLRSHLFRMFPPQFWSEQDGNKTMRIGCSQDDHIMAYIDFLDFSKQQENWLGLKLPMPVVLAGNGTFNHPYQLDFQNDSYVKSLVLIHFTFLKDKLPIFLQNFNTQLSKLSFYKLQPQVTRDLYKTVQWVERANKFMFNHFNIKCCLYILENQRKETDIGVFKQKRRSFPLETVFFDAFPEMYQNMLSYVKGRITSGKSEIRLALVFKKYSMSKQIGTQMRVNLLKQTGKDFAYKQAVSREESVLFDETDNDFQESKISYAGKKQPQEQNNRASVTSQGDLKNEQTMQKIKPIKLVDKSLRAFSISIDSSKEFELAIRKPRNKVKHHVNICRTSIYGLWLLFTKHHGSAPEARDLSSYFILYATILAIDILLLISFTFHCFIEDNFSSFGWAFFFLHFGVPYFAPLIAFVAAIAGNESLMKTSQHLNTMTVLFNYPITIAFLICKKDDLVYIFQLVIMFIFKFAINAVGAVIRQYLRNPRFSKNKSKIFKLLKRQGARFTERERILGKETAQQIDLLDDQNTYAKKLLAGLQPHDDAPVNQLQDANIDTDRLREQIIQT